MTSARPIGYYVHHHGEGHLRRALAIAAHLGDRLTLLGTGLAGRTGAIPFLELADDRLPGADFDGEDRTIRPPSLHYAPLDHAGVRQRVASVSAWVRDARPALMIVDVSVEMAMLARLASVPTVCVRLNGRRDDRPHLDAFAAADALMAPFHPMLEDPGTPQAIRARTFYAPGLTARPPRVGPDERRVLVVNGKGGTRISGDDLAAAARATPERRWRVIGPCAVPPDSPPNLDLAGWVEAAEQEVARAGTVVGGGGDGLVGVVIAARRPFVCIPEDRPFGEQRSKAERLAANDAALVIDRWPDAADWPAILDRAARLDPANLAQLDSVDGARRAAAMIASLADGRCSAARRSA